MVRYELAVILKAVGKPQLADTFKQVATVILKEGAILRSITNLGKKELPYRMKANTEWNTHGRYMLCDIEVGPQLALDVRQNIKKLTDVIRVSMVVK